MIDFERSVRRSWRTAVVSNGDAHNQRLKLAASGLSASFDAIAISTEVGVAKPDPRIFDIVLRELGVSASRTLHVGDDEVNDIAGASAAGLLTCWISTGRSFPVGPVRPTYQIESIANLGSVLGIEVDVPPDEREQQPGRDS